MVLEWPNKCKYWQEAKVKKLIAVAEMRWLDFRVRCCAWGQTLKHGPNSGLFPTKTWRLLSTMPGLDTALAKPCPQNHQHAVTCGSNTAISAKYPEAMASAFHKHYGTVTEHSDSDYLAARVNSTVEALAEKSEKTHTRTVSPSARG